MGKRSTREGFVAKAQKVHGNKYDYSRVDYQGSKIKVCIICPIHGGFYQTPNSHLNGQGCPICGNENKVTRVCNSNEWFVQNATLAHDNKYDYSKTEYKGSKSNIIITCPIHGDFIQNAYTHLKGSGCPKCAKEDRKMTTKQYVERCKEVHGDKYDYSLVKYSDIHERVTIICPKHGLFEQIANSHLRGQGCPKCCFENRKRPIFGFGINDYDGTIIDEHGKIEVFYSVWHSMIRRCYSKYHKQHGPTYEGCSVCEEWKYLSNFKKWFDENYIKGCHLDKDILVQGNKVYSPHTCCFVPQYINSLLTDHRAARGQCKIGVVKSGKTYVSSVNYDGKSIYLGTFATEQEAHLAYVQAKKDAIAKTAQKALDEGLIEKRIYNALISYEIKEY